MGISDIFAASLPELRIHVVGTNMTLNATALFLPLLSIFLVSRVVKYFNGLKAVNYLPGYRVPFQPLAFPGVVFPTTWWNPGVYCTWLWRSSLYKKFNSENISVVPFVSGLPVIYSSNLDVARQVVAGGHKSSFVKPESASQALLIWGMNLGAAEGEVWRKHRRVIGPAFNNRLYQHVWDQTLNLYREMISTEGWSDKDSVDVPVAQKLTFKLALLVIARCGFGFSFDWNTPPQAPNAVMSVQEALRIIVDNTKINVFAPWLLKLPFEKFRKVATANNQFTDFMRTSVVERRATVRGQTEKSNQDASDAFTMLVEANEEEAGKFKLSESELIGNVFLMLLAGHETTAHTLSATLGFLGYYQDIQDEVAEQVISEIGYDRDPGLDDYNKLYKILACFYESLRRFPSGYLMIREATEDTVLSVPNPPGQEGNTALPILKGTQVVVDMVGVQYNPRYFDEPETFKPSRWYGVSSESEVFSAFSIGARACLGRKFALTESVCFLAMLLRDWKVEPLLRPGETKDAWRNRVLDAKVLLMLGVSDVPIRLTRRRSAH
ncbi:hypothetical protein AX17_002517 [Amanita inopinata Kibby_2008]|nr:hypothetical protein AX17_002517 [Amanita inopinata Kibby_2008]